jgi:hypothetical protein
MFRTQFQKMISVLRECSKLIMRNMLLSTIPGEQVARISYLRQFWATLPPATRFHCSKRISTNQSSRYRESLRRGKVGSRVVPIHCTLSIRLLCNIWKGKRKEVTAMRLARTTTWWPWRRLFSWTPSWSNSNCTARVCCSRTNPGHRPKVRTQMIAWSPLSQPRFDHLAILTEVGEAMSTTSKPTESR